MTNFEKDILFLEFCVYSGPTLMYNCTTAKYESSCEQRRICRKDQLLEGLCS